MPKNSTPVKITKQIPVSMQSKSKSSMSHMSHLSHPSDNVTRSHKSIVDSSEIQDIDETTSIPDAFEFDKRKCNESDQNAEDEYIKEVVMDRIIKYIKVDDLVKKKGRGT